MYTPPFSLANMIDIDAANQILYYVSLDPDYNDGYVTSVDLEKVQSNKIANNSKKQQQYSITQSYRVVSDYLFT